MPNHVTSSVEIKGPKDKIAKLIKETKITLDVAGDAEGGNEFDFNGIIPMPEELNITSGSSTDLGKMAQLQEEYDKGIGPKCDWWSERYPGVTDSVSLKAFLEKSEEEHDKRALREGLQALENKKKYGYETWYDWAYANWGTKWNAYDVQYIAHDDTHLVLSLNTAWDTPREIWRELRSRGLEINGIIHGEVDEHENLGDGGPFWTSVEYSGDFSS